MLTKKIGILAQLQAYKAQHPGPFWAGLGVATLSLFSMVTAFGTVAAPSLSDTPQHTVVERLSPPHLAAIDVDKEAFFREDRVQRGDTVHRLLQRLGIDDMAASEFLLQHPSTRQVFRQLTPGKMLSARTDAEGELLTLTLPLNGKESAIVVTRHGDGFVAGEQAIPHEIVPVAKSAQIRHSLFGATDAAGIPDGVATQLAEIFGGEIDFHRDLRKGDRLSVIYESISSQGRTLRSGRILAAKFVNNGKTHQAFWFANPNAGESGGAYYSVEGKSLRRAFLRSPLEFSRITSGFTAARFHPVLQQWRAHKGTDYGAPIGTRVKATSDGVVEIASVQSGYGNVIILRHQGRYSTLYGHLSGFAPGVRTGSRVSQGDVIGFVGMTGMTSGPHLHYEFRVDNVQKDPQTVALPTTAPLTPQQLSQFRLRSEAHLARLGLIDGVNLSMAE